MRFDNRSTLDFSLSTLLSAFSVRLLVRVDSYFWTQMHFQFNTAYIQSSRKPLTGSARSRWHNTVCPVHVMVVNEQLQPNNPNWMALTTNTSRYAGPSIEESNIMEWSEIFNGVESTVERIDLLRYYLRYVRNKSTSYGMTRTDLYCSVLQPICYALFPGKPH